MGISFTPEQEKSNGGTELLARQLQARMPKELLDNFQIIPSRMRTVDPEKVRVFWAHDLPGDPEADNALAQGGWSRFHRTVFVSNWQQQAYIQHYGMSWDRCVVIQNAIAPIQTLPVSKNNKIRIIYTSTPHRGLALLYPVFKKLCETHSDIELVVYSSFKVYGWDQRDQEFEPLFAAMRADPRVEFHQGGENEEVRQALPSCHIFAYPSVWLETSCLSLMEAMSTGLLCVHPNYGALYETAANWTVQYQWSPEPQNHCTQLYSALNSAIIGARAIVEGTEDGMNLAARLVSQKNYADVFYSWGMREKQWFAFLNSIVKEDRAVRTPDQGMFVYKAAIGLGFMIPTLESVMHMINSAWNLIV